MTTFNTGNPLGSTDPKDLFDNAEAIDYAVNDTVPNGVFLDRFGAQRKTLYQFQREAQAVVDGAGQTISDATARVFFARAEQMVASVGTHDKLALVHSDPDPDFNGQYFWDDTEEPAYGWRKTVLQPSSKEITDLLAQSIQSETEARQNAISQEAENRSQAIASLATAVGEDLVSVNQNLSDESQTRQQADQALSQSLSSEVEARGTAIAAEAQARAAAIQSVNQSVSTEATARSEADTALGQNIATEAQARAQAISAEAAARADAIGMIDEDLQANKAVVKDMSDFMAPQQQSSEYESKVSSSGGEVEVDDDDMALRELSPDGYRYYVPVQLDEAKVLFEDLGGTLIENVDASLFALSDLPDDCVAWLDEDDRLIRLEVPDGVDPDPQPELFSLRSGEILVGVLGDSRTAVSFTTRRANPRGYPYWVEMLSRGAFRFRSDLQFALSGATSTIILADYAPAAAASPAQMVIVLGGEVNDTDGAESVANIQAMVDMLRAAGKMVVVIAELPRSLNWNSTRRNQHYANIQALLKMSTQEGVRVVNAFEKMVDPMSALGAFRPEMTNDLLHLTSSGGLALGRAVWEAIKDLAHTQAPLFVSAADVYHATSNRTGNIVVNGLMAGVAGTKSGSGSVTGDVADSWSITATEGFTVVASKFTGTDGRQWQAMQVNAVIAASSNQCYLSQTIDISKITAGDVLECMTEIDVAAGAVEAYGPQFEVWINNALYAVWGISSPATAISPNPGDAYGGVLRIERFVAPAGMTSMFLRMAVRGDVGKTLSTNFRQTAMSIRKII